MKNTCVKSESWENSSQISSENNLDNNIEGFDFLRAIFSIIIVALKTNRLISLYIFWVGLKVLFDIFVRGKSERFARIISSPRSLIEFIISGSQSPFFFLFSLILLTTIATIIITLLKKTEKKSKLIISYGLLFVSCLLTFSLSVTEIVV